MDDQADAKLFAFKPVAETDYGLEGGYIFEDGPEAGLMWWFAGKVVIEARNLRDRKMVRLEMRHIARLLEIGAIDAGVADRSSVRIM